MEYYLGQIILAGFNFAPVGWLRCDGQLLPINQNPALFSLLGTTYGGDGMRNFALPKMEPVMAAGSAPVYYYIATQGVFPSRP